MNLIKSGRRQNIWRGSCRNCGAEFEANKDELTIQNTCEGGHAHHSCSECGASRSVIFYPKVTER